MTTNRRETINPLVSEECIKVHTVFRWAIWTFLLWRGEGEETNSNTFTTVSLHLLGRWGVCYSHTVCDIEPCSLIILSFTQSPKLDIAYSTLETHAHTHAHTDHILALFLASRYSRIPLELLQGEPCILFGRMKFLERHI